MACPPPCRRLCNVEGLLPSLLLVQDLAQQAAAGLASVVTALSRLLALLRLPDTAVDDATLQDALKVSGSCMLSLSVGPSVVRCCGP